MTEVGQMDGKVPVDGWKTVNCEVPRSRGSPGDCIFTGVAVKLLLPGAAAR